MRLLFFASLTFILLPAMAVAGEPLPLAAQIAQQAKRDCEGLDNGSFQSTERTGGSCSARRHTFVRQQKFANAVGLEWF